MKKGKINLEHLDIDLENKLDIFVILIDRRMKRHYPKGKKFTIYYGNMYLGVAKVIFQSLRNCSMKLVDNYSYEKIKWKSIRIYMEWVK
ncbi:MAG: hypothetical protein ACP6IY_19335 [Promethearchaeia archaeon]